MDSQFKKLNIEFNEAKKPQSLQTLKDIIEAAEKIVAGGDVDHFVARQLVKKSGYSLGSLIKRFGKIENIFLYAITLERSRHIRIIGESLEKIGAHENVVGFVSQTVDICLEALNKFNSRIMKYYEKRAALRAESVSDIYLYSEEMIPYLKRSIVRNQSKTIRHFSDDEFRYLARAILLFLERPFAEGDPIAGSAAHRAMAVNALVGLLKA